MNYEVMGSSLEFNNLFFNFLKKEKKECFKEEKNGAGMKRSRGRALGPWEGRRRAKKKRKKGGEEGIGSRGGQKARNSLARSVRDKLGSARLDLFYFLNEPS